MKRPLVPLITLRCNRETFEKRYSFPVLTFSNHKIYGVIRRDAFPECVNILVTWNDHTLVILSGCVLCFKQEYQHIPYIRVSMYPQ